MSVNLSEADIDNYIDSITDLPRTLSITVACIISPQNVTLSGTESDLDALQNHFSSDGIFTRKLQTGVPYHSPVMNSISMQYGEAIQELRAGDTPSQAVTMVSSVSGEIIANTDALATSEYWVNNMVRPVKSPEAMAKVLSTGQKTPKHKLGAAKGRRAIFDVIEVGPHSALQRPIKEIRNHLKLKQNFTYHSVLSRPKCPIVSTLEVVGRLHASGYPVELNEVNQSKKYHPNQGQAICDLPEYPFNHSRTHWHEHWTSRNARFREHPPLDLLGTAVNDWNLLEARWHKVFDVLQTPWIEHHTVSSIPVL